MSCINANIAFTKSISASIENATKCLIVNATITKTIIVNCSLVCGVHNSLNILTNSGKILFDGNKLLLI
jgi:hypothetical protein